MCQFCVPFFFLRDTNQFSWNGFFRSSFDDACFRLSCDLFSSLVTWFTEWNSKYLGAMKSFSVGTQNIRLYFQFYTTLLRESMDFVYITFRSESINLLCNGNIALEASFESFLNKCNSLDSSRKKSHNRPKFGYRFGHLWIELYQSQKMLINRVNKLDGSFFSLIRLFIICHFDAHFLIEFANFFCIL